VYVWMDRYIHLYVEREREREIDGEKGGGLERKGCTAC